MARTVFLFGPLCSASPALHYAGMIAPTDNQLKAVMDAARTLPAAMLALRGRGRFGDGDVHEVTALALCGLVHNDAA